MTERLFSVEEILTDVPEKATKKVFYENERLNGAVWYVPAGEELPAHYHPETDDVWVVLQGKGEYFLGDGKTAPLEKGMVAVAAKTEIHGIKATGDEPLVFVAFAAPLPVEMIKVDK
ncbi:quercetin dioxygenase-like cupin family protein [Desulfitispora alkaliphila]|uniref:cupin domain-containing protein n=1 Tax=Desulfitispora alkaliphila TaxID=622674 RepID=UPI003D22BAB2